MKKNFRSIFSLVLAFTIVSSTGTVALASTTNDLGDESSLTLELETASFQQEQVKEINFSTDVKDSLISNKAFTNETNLNYIDSSINLTSSSSGDGLWQYNTGTTLPRAANYSKYNLLDIVKKGDIIHESKGGFGVTGHTAIVEGIYYSSTYNQYYIRVIEAISDGIVRSVFDDDRLDAKEASIYRVPSATSTKINAAVAFSVSQLGDSYFLDFQKDYDDQPDWYCSELVWASYKRQGIDIETTGTLNEPGITPRDIIRCSLTSKINYSTK